jgi:ABC-2 type transport system ATP-binding protein
MLLTLLVPTSGNITVGGLNLQHHSHQIKQMMGLMTQETVVEADLTGRQNLERFAKLYHIPEKEIPKRIHEALDEADLVKFADVKTGTYSGGMQRRLGLVRAMIQEPRILLLDEPTTGLDVQNRVTMWKRIKDLNKAGTTIIMTTQYLEEADALCDRIAIIDHGKVVAQGTPSELKKLAGEGRILEIVAKADDIPKIAAMLKSRFKLQAEQKADKLTAVLEHDPSKTFMRITEELSAHGMAVVSINMHLPTLDDVFIKLTGSAYRDTTGEMQGGRMQNLGRGFR